MKLIFMRHGFLEGKFGDYTKLKFKDFEDLLLRNIEPAINKERTKIKLQKKLDERRLEFDAMITSAQNRGIETGRIVSELTKIELSKKTELLNETSFETGVIEPSDTKNYGGLRRKVLTQMFNSNHTENFEGMKKRFMNFLEETKNVSDYKDKTILCITHGWFMRIIELYKEKENLEITLSELLEVKPTDFLDTIEINMVA